MAAERAGILIKIRRIAVQQKNAVYCFYLTILPREFPKSQILP